MVQVANAAKSALAGVQGEVGKRRPTAWLKRVGLQVFSDMLDF